LKIRKDNPPGLSFSLAQMNLYEMIFNNTQMLSDLKFQAENPGQENQTFSYICDL